MNHKTETALFSAPVQIDRDVVFADMDKRTITGLLLPFGELSQPSKSGTEPVMFSAGTVELPADPIVCAINEEHSQFKGRGHAVELVETAQGIVAEFAIGRTPEGDKILAQANDPDPAKRPKLSAEVERLVRRGTQAVSAALTGAAITARGAFGSAAVFSVVDDAVEVLEETDAVDEIPEDDKDDLVETVTEAVLEALTNANTTEEGTMTASARAPQALRRRTETNTDTTSLNGLFAALASSSRSGDKSALEPYLAGEAAFAIANINHAGPSGATIGTDIAVPTFIGQLWDKRQYTRRFFDLCQTAPLESFEIKGWRFVDGKVPTMAAYTGNGNEIPSNAVDTEPVTETARRIAGGHKIDRRFVDFPDQGFWEAYFEAMRESYLRVSDLDSLNRLVTTATTVTMGTVPTDVAPALAGIVDGALGVIATENTPAWAVVSSELWRDIVLTGKNEVLGYLSAAFGLEEGSLDGFRIIPGPVGEGKVLVGAREARTMYELPGAAPIRVEGLVPSTGQIEPALYGYIGDVTHNAKALSLVTVTAPGTGE